jgi:hypothetical protein
MTFHAEQPCRDPIPALPLPRDFDSPPVRSVHTRLGRDPVVEVRVIRSCPAPPSVGDSSNRAPVRTGHRSGSGGKPVLLHDPRVARRDESGPRYVALKTPALPQDGQAGRPGRGDAKGRTVPRAVGPACVYSASTTLPQHHSGHVIPLLRWQTFRFRSGLLRMPPAGLEPATRCLEGASIYCGLLPPVAQSARRAIDHR